MSKKPTGPKDFKDKKSADSPHSLSRKSFLKTSALATASTFFFVPRHVLGGPGYTAPRDQLNLAAIGAGRSEEHTSELQSRGQRLCRLLLERKKRRHTSEHR